jgi:hypothetical protein
MFSTKKHQDIGMKLLEDATRIPRKKETHKQIKWMSKKVVQRHKSLLQPIKNQLWNYSINIHEMEKNVIESRHITLL